jgi:hypothetical protein
MMQIRRGITRTVFLVGHWAVKVPSTRVHGGAVRGLLWSLTRGIQANLSEAEWSGTTGACPVLWSLAGLVNVYPRCRPVEPDHEIDWEGIGFLAPVDRKHDNVGWLDGRIVMIDYDMSWNDCPHGHPKRPLVAEQP